MHGRDNEELSKIYEPILTAHGVSLSHDKMLVVVNAIKQRATFPSEFWGLSDFLFSAPTEYEAKAREKYWKEDTPAMISGLRDVLATIDDWHNQNMEHICHEWIVVKGYKMGAVMNAFRLAIVGESRGFGMYEMCEVLSKDETLRRIDRALIAM
jgi:glutamyl-tRNA synthetase